MRFAILNYFVFKNVRVCRYMYNSVFAVTFFFTWLPESQIKKICLLTIYSWFSLVQIHFLIFPGFGQVGKCEHWYLYFWGLLLFLQNSNSILIKGLLFNLTSFKCINCYVKINTIIFSYLFESIFKLLCFFEVHHRFMIIFFLPSFDSLINLRQ